jgi:hypothetical protein
MAIENKELTSSGELAGCKASTIRNASGFSQTLQEPAAGRHGLLKKGLTARAGRRAILAVSIRASRKTNMTTDVVPRYRLRRRSPGLWLSLAVLAVLIIAAGSFVSYELWPTWSKQTFPPNAPAIPVTVGDVLFNIPPAAIRAPVQRHPGAHERIDMVLLWPSLTPPAANVDIKATSVTVGKNGAVPSPAADDRLFVTIAPLGAELKPIERLRTIYTRYIEAQATAGPDGLAILPFRAGTPYEGEDLIYFADQPERFFALCSRPVHAVPGTCIHERALDAAEITLRFPRHRLQGWRNVVAGFDRLLAQIHPPQQ